MTVQSLQTSLQAQASGGGRVELLAAMRDAGDPPPADFSSLLLTSLMVGADLAITVATIPPATAAGLDFQGQADVLGLARVAVDLHFTDNAQGGIDLRLVVTLPQGWTFGQSFPGITGCDADRLDLRQAVFVLTTASHDIYQWQDSSGRAQATPLARGLNFVADLQPGGLLGALAHVVEGGIAAMHVPFAGPVDPAPLARGVFSPDMTISGPIGGTLVAVPYFALSAPSLVLANIPGAKDGPGEVPFVALAVTLAVKGQSLFTVSSPFYGNDKSLTFNLVADQGGISLATICDLVGGDNIKAELPDFLETAFSAVGFKAFRVTLQLSPMTIMHYGVTVGATQPWHFGDFSVDNITLDYSVLNPNGPGKQSFTFFHTQIEFFKNVFPGFFDIEIGQDSDGAFQVLADYEGVVVLNDLVREISNGTVQLPQDVASIDFSNFGLSFAKSGGSWDWSLFGRCDMAFSLPVASGEAEAALNVLIASTGGQMSYKLQGSLLLGTSYFEVDLDLGADHKLLTGKWQAQGAQYLGFNDLAAAMHLPSPGIPSDLDLALSEATVAYDFQNKTFMIEATSERYGKAIFIATSTQDGALYAFGVDVHLGITLADLPLVGGKLPDAEKLGIDDFKVWILSRTVTKAETEAVNALVQTTHYPPLPDQDIGKRLLLDGALRLGEQGNVPLSVGVGDADVQPAPATPSASGPAPAPATPAQAQDDGTTWLSIQRQIGPFQFNRIGIAYKSDALRVALDAGITLGPFSLSMDGLSISSPLTEFKPSFDLSGLGLSYSSGPVEIGGALLKLPSSELSADTNFQFDGTIVAKAEAFSLAGIGSYAQLRSGDPSLFVFAQLDVPLGGPPPFFVTGLMAGMGFNRNLAIPGQDEVQEFPLLLLAQPPAPNQPAAAQDPMSVLRILEGETAPPGFQPKKWIAPQPGALWFAIGINFTSFEIVRSKALVVIEPVGDFTVALLGLSTLQLPQPAESSQTYAYVELQLRAVFQPQDGLFSATAILSNNSYVLTPDCHLTGGFAFSLWFGSNPHAGEFVVTLGGYHPAFTPPAYYPQVPRLGFNWAVSDHVSIKGDSYFALTPSCAMAGGGLEVLFHDGDLSAWFTAHADLLVSWRPFFYIADIDVSMGVSYRLNLLFCHKTISISIGASVNMWGPPTGGRVHVHLVVVTFTVSFGSDSAGQDQQPLGWSDMKSLLPHPASVCTVTASSAVAAMSDDAASSSGKRWVVRPRGFSFSTASAIPASTLAADGHGGPSASSVGSGIAIRPMNRGNVASTHTVKISRNSKDAAAIDLAGWSFEPRTQSMPEALWSQPPQPFSQIPGTPSAKTIPGMQTGYSVSVPEPTLGPACGPIPFEELLEEYLSPPGEAPLSPGVAADASFVASASAETIHDIAALMDQPALDARAALFGVISQGGFYAGANGSLAEMAANAGHLFSDSPMLQA